ncbi:DUF551 domain-containing protein [Enterobacter hormaechei]
MITFTKEQLIAAAHARIEFAEMMLAGELEPLKERTWSIELELARIALASLEAEPVAWRHFQETPTDGGYWILNDYKPNCSGVEPLFTAPPAPEFVPLAIHDEDFEKALSVLNDTLDDCGDSERGLLLALDKVGIEVRSDARRAAMLQGAEPVKSGLTLREGLAAIRNSGIAIDAGKIQAERDALNSPVTPNGWVACSDRMPDIGTEIFYFCQDDGLRGCGIVSSSNFSGRGHAQLYVHGEGYDMRFGVDITHWMPLPAAPQQEDIIC